MSNKRIARIARESFLKEPLLEGFSDIRKNPTIPLQTILMSFLTMVFFGTRSLLSIDRVARKERYRQLFGCQRKMVCSDSTAARVLGWLKYREAERFLLKLVRRFERRDLLRRRLSSGGRQRRLGIVDGTYMGGHWLVSLTLAGRIAYPVMVRGCRSQGEELEVARQMMREAPRLLGEAAPQLWLLDGLYFNVNTVRIAREQRAHVLFKFKQAEFRTVSRDAQNLFEHFGGDEEQQGWDGQRMCSWKVRKTLDRFGGYPVQVVELLEYYPKAKKGQRRKRCWIVSTALDLSLEEIREAAHQRWTIENDVFKRMNHLAGTKRFYFKDAKRFLTLLHFLFAAMALLDSIMVMLRDHPRVFAALRAGIKPTWLNVFSQMQEVVYGIPRAFAGVMGMT